MTKYVIILITPAICWATISWALEVIILIIGQIGEGWGCMHLSNFLSNMCRHHFDFTGHLLSNSRFSFTRAQVIKFMTSSGPQTSLYHRHLLNSQSVTLLDQTPWCAHWSALMMIGRCISKHLSIGHLMSNSRFSFRRHQFDYLGLAHIYANQLVSCWAQQCVAANWSSHCMACLTCVMISQHSSWIRQPGACVLWIVLIGNHKDVL